MTNTEDRGPYEIETVLLHEAAEIHGALPHDNIDSASIYARLNLHDSAALCLSGGGIRSAAFCLGVIQRLAGESTTKKSEPAPDNSLLTKFHYLSTVSGGGYIGSWLSVWIHRAGYESVWNDLHDLKHRASSEVAAISWLRSYSNYLTPRIGLFSLDAWAGIALLTYNLVLNWLVLLPFVFILVLVFKLFAFLSISLPYFLNKTWSAAIGALGVVLFVSSLGYWARNRPSRQRFSSVAEGQSAFLSKSLLLATIAAIALTQSFVTRAPFDLLATHPYLEGNVLFKIAAMGALCGVTVYAASSLISRPWQNNWRDFWLWTFSGAPFGALVYFGFSIFQLFAFGTKMFGGSVPPFALHLVFGVPLILISQLVGIIFFFGLTSHDRQSDVDQEWLGRAGGWILLVCMSWVAITFLILLSGPLAPWFYDSFSRWIGAVGGFSGIVVWIIGRFGLAPPGEPKNNIQLLFKIILAVAAPTFAIVLLFAISDLTAQFDISAVVDTTILSSIGNAWIALIFKYLFAIFVA
jgi:hypothetical protein